MLDGFAVRYRPPDLRFQGESRQLRRQHRFVRFPVVCRFKMLVKSSSQELKRPFAFVNLQKPPCLNRFSTLRNRSARSMSWPVLMGHVWIATYFATDMQTAWMVATKDGAVSRTGCDGWLVVEYFALTGFLCLFLSSVQTRIMIRMRPVAATMPTALCPTASVALMGHSFQAISKPIKYVPVETFLEIQFLTFDLLV